ncbi:MAG: tetratricopeptide repeat protein [Pseudomonadota bacterium]
MFDMKRAGLGVLALALAACTQPQDPIMSGVSMMQEGSYQQAKSHFEGLLANDPTDPYVNLNLGVANAELGDKATAASYYRVAIEEGQSARIGTTVTGDEVDGGASTTVAALAARNLELLN